MYAVYVKKKDGKAQTFENANNISVSKARVLIVVADKMYTYLPGDLIEVKFSWNGYERR